MGTLSTVCCLRRMRYASSGTPKGMRKKKTKKKRFLKALTPPPIGRAWWVKTFTTHLLKTLNDWRVPRMKTGTLGASQYWSTSMLAHLGAEESQPFTGSFAASPIYRPCLHHYKDREDWWNDNPELRLLYSSWGKNLVGVLPPYTSLHLWAD